MCTRKCIWLFLASCMIFVLSCGPEIVKARKMDVPQVDLATVEDGVYTGEYSGSYRMKVTVVNHEITEIEVLSSEGDEFDTEALPVLDRVMDKQSLDVDAVVGATKSSECFLRCVYNALAGE